MESSSYQAGVIQQSPADYPQFLVSDPASQLPFRTPAQVHVDPTIVKEYNFSKFFRYAIFPISQSLQPTPRAIQNAAGGQNEVVRIENLEQVLNFRYQHE